MRKFKFCLSATLVAILLVTATPAKAQLVFGASFDFMGDLAAAVTPVFEQAQTVKDQIITKVKEKITSLKAALSKYTKKRKNPAERVPGTKNFVEGSVDIYDPDAVQAAVMELFLQYPSNERRIMDEYDAVTDQFYYDTIVEIYTATKQMEKQLDSLRKDREIFASGLLGEKTTSDDDSSAMEADDENASYYNLYMANKKFNDVVKLTQEIMALYVQYYAAQAIYTNIVIPAPFDPDAQKEGAADGESNKDTTQKTSSVRFKENVAFAQMLSTNRTSGTNKASLNSALPMQPEAMPATAEIAEAKKGISSDSVASPNRSSIAEAYSQYQESLASQPKVSKIPFEKTEKLTIESTLYKNLDKMEDLAELAEIQKVLNSALKAHNSLQLLPSYRELYIQRDLYRQLHQKAIEVLETSDQCVIQYLGRRYNNPERVWFGQNTPPKIANDYNNRRGLSGWAITAYQVANAEKTANIDVDSFGTVDFAVDYDNDDLSSDPVGEMLSKEDSDKYALASPSKEGEFADSIREVELLTFQIGAQAAKILADDQYSGNPVYGNAYNKYPVWEDQKSFYNQYLEGKYKNMRSYIEKVNVASAAVEVAKMINDGKDDDLENPSKSKNAAALNKLAQVVSNLGSDDNSVTLIQNKKKAELESLSKQEAAALLPHQTKLEELNEKLDNISDAINYTNEQISQADSAANEAKIKAETAHQNIVRANNRDPNGESALRSLAHHEFSEGSKDSLLNTEKAGRLRVEVKKLEEQRNQISAQIDQVNAQIERIKQSYVLGRNTTEENYDNMIKNMEESGSSGVVTLRSLASQNGITGGFTFNAILSAVDGMVGKARDNGKEIIEKAESDIMKMGDSLYEPHAHSTVVSRHKKLISDLQTLSSSQFSTLARSILGTGGTGISGITSAMSGIFRAALVNNVCANSVCDKADTEYFVGVPSKARDFRAPKSPFAERYPHIRDIVHFDLTDYKNVTKAAGGVVSKESFLNSGGQFPAIWKQILSAKPYVEKTIRLDEILNKGGEDRAYMRSHIYPCRIGTKVIDVNNREAKYMVSENADSKLQPCLEVTMKGIIGFYTITDKDSGESGSAGKQEYAPKVKPSELGLLLKFEKGKLMFNNQPQTAFENILAKEEEAKKNDVKYKLKDIIFEKTMLVNNQIGNFVHFVDKELNVKKSVEEIEASINDATVSLRELLSEMGFDSSPNINLANDNEYETIQRRLKNYKSNLIGSATSRLELINKGDPVIDEVYNKVSNLRSALVQDANELVSLGTETKAGNPLAEMILTEEANKKVIEKAQQQGYDAIRKEIENFEIPMCVVY